MHKKRNRVVGFACLLAVALLNPATGARTRRWLAVRLGAALTPDEEARFLATNSANRIGPRERTPLDDAHAIGGSADVQSSMEAGRTIGDTLVDRVADFSGGDHDSAGEEPARGRRPASAADR